MHLLWLLSLSWGLTNVPPSHNVFFVALLAISGSNQPPAIQPQCILWATFVISRFSWLAHPVTMYSIWVLWQSHNPTDHLPSHSAFLVITFIVLKSGQLPSHSIFLIAISIILRPNRLPIWLQHIPHDCFCHALRFNRWSAQLQCIPSTQGSAAISHDPWEIL